MECNWFFESFFRLSSEDVWNARDAYYRDAGKIFDKHSIKAPHRGFLTAIGQLFIVPYLMLKATTKQVKGSDFVKVIHGSIHELPSVKKLSCNVENLPSFSMIEIKKNFWPEFMEFLSKTRMDLGDYSGMWDAVAGSNKETGFFPTPPDIVTDISLKVIFEDIPAFKMRFLRGEWNFAFDYDDKTRHKMAKEGKLIRVYDPAVGTGSMMFQCIDAGFEIHGQEIDPTIFLMFAGNYSHRTTWARAELNKRRNKIRNWSSEEVSIQQMMDIGNPERAGNLYHVYDKHEYSVP